LAEIGPRPGNTNAGPASFFGQSLRLKYSKNPDATSVTAPSAFERPAGTSSAPLKAGPVKNFEPVTITMYPRSR